MEFKNALGERMEVSLVISCYVNNSAIYIGLVAEKDGVQETHDATTDLGCIPPDYCGFLDTNNMPGVEEFITENGLGYFTGLIGKSGYWEYPLYYFNSGKLRELCPDGMFEYEKQLTA